MVQSLPTQLFEELLTLLRASRATEAEVRQRLLLFTTRTRPVSTRLGRTYLLIGGPFFQVTATFEGPDKELYQVTLRLTPAAYTEVKAYARTVPTTIAGSRWYARWLGLAPRLKVPLAEAGSPGGITAYFVGLLPQRKLVVLTRWQSKMQP